MSEPFLGEIRMFAGNFAPRGYALCDGQLLSPSQEEGLFSLIGTTYGGDGETTFGLPDLRGRIPVHAGSGPGLTPVSLGAKAGVENVTLDATQLPTHRHGLQASRDAANNAADPVGDVTGDSGGTALYGADPAVALDANAVRNTGGSRSHDNMAPSLAIYFIIALVGIDPSS